MQQIADALEKMTSDWVSQFQTKSAPKAAQPAAFPPALSSLQPLIS